MFSPIELCSGSGLVTRPEAKQTLEAEQDRSIHDSLSVIDPCGAIRLIRESEIGRTLSFLPYFVNPLRHGAPDALEGTWGHPRTEKSGSPLPSFIFHTEHGL
jgi:hypothetical protein